MDTLGSFIRTQRRLANLTLREMADLAKVSNPYLSQIERGLHEPSVRVLRSIASALNISAETLLAQAGLLDGSAGSAGTAAGTPVGTPGADSDGASPPPGAEARRAGDGVRPTEAAIRLDPGLSPHQKEALLAVYRSFLAAEG